jgi:tetratricopeptide (TPR) repeat protein
MIMADDLQQQILEELRNQTALVRKANRTNTIVYGILMAIFVISIILTPFIRDNSRTSSTSPQCPDSWQQAKNLLDQGESGKADEMVQRLIEKNPQFWYGYAFRGAIQQELGNFNEAEGYYAKAYDLFPTEDNKKTLDAIRTVLKNKASVNK